MKAYYNQDRILIYNGDCIKLLKSVPSESVEAIVTDPPYELGFMGKGWDSTGISNNVDMWRECLRVLKPGGHLLAFSGTRTYHRMACAIEDAGFEVRDMIEWVYGSGFPKSLNIGKAVDKLQGNEKEEKEITYPDGSKPRKTAKHFSSGEFLEEPRNTKYTKGTSEWEGWGTALKPAHEPICMARKPLAEKTVAENCLKYGTGGINIDESRVGTEIITQRLATVEGGKAIGGKGVGIKQKATGETTTTIGRFPANLIHDNSEEVRECFPNVGKGNGKGAYNYAGREYDNKDTSMFNGDKPQAPSNFNDSGNASRFFKSIIYTAKASKSERNKGCEDIRTGNLNYNNHPTVKPIALMEYLINMVTRQGQTILDPFMGSGTTGVASKILNRNFIGIEIDSNYCEVSVRRIKSVQRFLPLEEIK